MEAIAHLRFHQASPQKVRLVVDLIRGHSVEDALVVTGLILGIGMCWSSLRRALSGQADVDEVDSH